MTHLVSEDEIEDIVGASRHPILHIAYAHSVDKIVYILHPEDCASKKTYRSLNECIYSRTLDLGIDEEVWKGFTDIPVYVRLTVNGMVPTLGHFPRRYNRA